MVTAIGCVQAGGVIAALEIGNLKSPSWVLRPLDDQLVSELARSIRNAGLLQPIVVRRHGEGYEVVFGNHRLEACKRAGLKKIPSIIGSYTDDEAFLARVSENLLRNSQVDPIEEAQGYKMLVRKGWSINGIAQRVGKCDSYVCERLALLDRLTVGIRSKISGKKGHLSASHAEILSRIRGAARQNEVAELVERKRLSVRALEALLNGSPLPRIIQVESVSGETCVHIPSEFAEACGLNAGQSLYIYVEGRKLVLDNLENKAGRKTRKRTSQALLVHCKWPPVQPTAV